MHPQHPGLKISILNHGYTTEVQQWYKKKIIKKSKCIKNKIAFTFWVSDTHFYVDEALYLKKKINEISFIGSKLLGLKQKCPAARNLILFFIFFLYIFLYYKKCILNKTKLSPIFNFAI